MQSIELCVARFDEDTKASFLDLYTKIDVGVLTRVKILILRAQRKMPSKKLCVGVETWCFNPYI